MNTPTEHSVLLRVLRAAAMEYHSSLLSTPDVLEYLGGVRQFSDPEGVAKRYGLGYAPARGEGPDISKKLDRERRSMGLTVPEFARILVDAGLQKTGQDGRPRDAFRGRLLFPLLRRGAPGDPCGWNGDGAEIVGFGGRILPHVAAAMPEGFDPPRYLNIRETELCRKREMLHGLFPWAARAISSSNEVFLVEGYMDWLRMQVVGATNTVALCGTSLTTEHLALLKRVARRNKGPLVHYLLTDNDPAGRAGADRASETIARSGGVARLMPPLPNGEKDVDESLAPLSPSIGLSLIRKWCASSDLPQLGGLSAIDNAAWSQSLAALHFGLRRARRMGQYLDAEDRQRLEEEARGRLLTRGRLRFSPEAIRSVLSVAQETSP